jgi:hydrogenase expression/formation protein HypC
MCLAVPGKIIEINGDLVKVDYKREIREAKLVSNNFKVGDYVIVQGKVVIEKVPKEDVKKWLDLFK